MSKSTIGPDTLHRAAYVPAPVAGSVIQLDISTTAARFIIPASWAGQWVTATLFADTPTDATVAADIVFGGSTVSCTYNQDSTVASEAITVSNASGLRLLSGGQSASFVMPKADVAGYFSVDGSGNARLQLVKG